MSLKAYRTALRATQIAFKQDLPVLRAARLQIKDGMIKNKDLPEAQANEEIEKLNEISKFLVKNIVQGKMTDGKYFLNFHEQTELGDNETIKQGKKHDEMGSLVGKKGSSIKKCS